MVEVTKEKRTVTVETDVVVLALTKEEASALLAVTYKIGGSPSTTRGVFDKIGVGLEKQGVTSGKFAADGGLLRSIDNTMLSGNLYFE